ncbi:MAG: polysaccharide deacetylase family protein, partial [Planctomycetes bacterium]|nr:polysaccharide deacetylase family protein [Planctomycetota bacterium]
MIFGQVLFVRMSGLAALFIAYKIAWNTHPLKIPVLMYHSVADRMEDLPWGELVCTVTGFADQMSYLNKNGFHGISLYDLRDHIKEGKRLPRKPVVITFDDGYLDNWVNAMPLLKKYGMQATVFVSLDFIDPKPKVRPTLEQVWAGTLDESSLQTVGYLSWEELRQAQASGIIDVQSHGGTHTWHFKGNRVMDFRHPGDPYFWMDWNRKPERKPYWRPYRGPDEDQLGTPVYDWGKAMLVKRYFPEDTLAEAL